ncbi:MAG TPA: methyltransferase domain-containing protein, partial [Chloroflexia bacterium]|nr:methyltransferase domain-containing protein [Chloroflexia bacterium]
MTGDQQPADLLDLPFDQYQRYHIAGDILASLARHAVLPAAPAILDVGGYPGLLPRFVASGARTVVLDVVPDTASAQHYGYTYVIGSGMQLPFPDGSFDCVVSLDTLEHVPAEARPTLLAEMRRVGRHAALFVGPVHREETALTEELLFDYIQWLLKARQEQLAEHRGYGLPDLVATRTAFNTAGWTTFDMPAGNLYNWLFMMVAKHYLISFHDPQADEFERRLDHYYNVTFSPTDRQEPAYRGVLVATREAHPQALAAIAEAYPPLPSNEGANMTRLELSNLLLRLFDLKVANHEDRALREQLEHRDRNITALTGKADGFERELSASRAHAGNLQDVVDELRLRIGEAAATLASTQTAQAAIQVAHDQLTRN